MRIRNRRTLLAGWALALLVMALCAGQALAAPAWLPATDLSAPLRDANGTRVAMDDAGHTVAVWQRQESVSSSLSVQVSTREPGAGFSAPVDLSHHSQDPAVAMTPGGEAVVAWWRFKTPPGVYVLEAATRQPGGSFSPPVQVTELAENIGSPPEIQLALNSAGDTAIAWTSRDPLAEFPNATFVEASVRPGGGSFSTPKVVSAPPLFEQQSANAPRVAIDAAGDVTVVWKYDEVIEEEVEEGVFEEVVSEVLVQAAFRPAGGEFSSPETLSEGGEDAFSPAVAMDSAGDAIAVWARGEGEELTVQASVRPSGAAFLSAKDLSSAGADSFSPDIAMTPSGAATAIWIQSEAGTRSAEAATRPPGGQFASPKAISAEGEEPLFPTIAVNADGDAVVSWSGIEGAGEEARAVTRVGNGDFSAPVGISATEPECCFHPDAAIDKVGDAVVVWNRSNGANRIAQAAGFDADAPELRGLSIPPTGTVGVPVGFSVDPFDEWPIATTTFDFGDGASAAGTAVTHTYSSPGTFHVTATTVDAAGTPTLADGTISIAASNHFHLRKVKRKKRTGRATIVVDVPGPGRLTLSGKGVKRVTGVAGRAGSVTLPIKPKGGALKGLDKRGKAKVKIAVLFAPDGGSPATQHKTITLIKKP